MEVDGMPDEEMSAFHGVTRRDFLKFCGGIAVLIGLGPAGTADVAEALEAAAKRPNVVWSSFQECTGCAISLLQSRTPQVANLILNQISLDYQENVMAAAGDAAAKAFDETVAKGGFYWVVEGGIPITIPEAMAVRGKTALDIAKDTYPKAAATIAIGSCACYGNIQAAKPNPTGSVGVADALTHAGVANPVVINISRCPGNAEDMIAVLSYVLVTGKVPPLDSIGRPTFLYGTTIHDSCFRRGHFEAGEFATDYNDPNINEAFCLYKLGCKGPVTYAPCGFTQWNGHVSWCVHNAPCIGCSEPQFWDKLTPFTQQLPGLGPFPAQTVGEVLGAAVVIGLGAHLIGSAATGRFGRHEEPPSETPTGGR
jgi:NiFe hydrogenase small subunit HydA